MKSHTTAPGTSTRGGVNGTMDSPFGGKKVNGRSEGTGGTYDRNKAPFDQPRDTGGGGIKTKFFEDVQASVPKAGANNRESDYGD